jgi:TonB family protein
MDNISFNNDIHLTSEELMAYSQGNLSNSEMHRLELHLINCELCNDALDGMVNINEAPLINSLASIRAKTETKSSISISISNKQWLAMAASVALIAVVSIIFLLPPESEEPSIAEKPPIQDELLAVDTSSLKDNDTEDSLFIIAQREDSLLALADAPPPRYTARNVPAKDVLAEEAKGLDVSDISTVSPEIATATDSDILADNIALDFTDDEITTEEGRDTAARSKKMVAPAAGVESPVAMAAPKEDSKLEENSAYKTAQPVKGRRSYERYFKRNLKYPDAAKKNKIAGEVILVLNINTYGSITNIEVVQSLGYGCDQEAIRLIREGPEWVPGTRNNVVIDDKVMVSVPFKL